MRQWSSSRLRPPDSATETDTANGQPSPSSRLPMVSTIVPNGHHRLIRVGRTRGRDDLDKIGFARRLRKQEQLPRGIPTPGLSSSSPLPVFAQTLSVRQGHRAGPGRQGQAEGQGQIVLAICPKRDRPAPPADCIDASSWRASAGIAALRCWTHRRDSISETPRLAGCMRSGRRNATRRGRGCTGRGNFQNRTRWIAG